MKPNNEFYPNKNYIFTIAQNQLLLTFMVMVKVMVTISRIWTGFLLILMLRSHVTKSHYWGVIPFPRVKTSPQAKRHKSSLLSTIITFVIR